uniref:BRAP2 domain-containing protein n=1 Tax=Macrostomum lignano TaxID=282301 RepID=A0A1I8F9F1_9PLAT
SRQPRPPRTPQKPRPAAECRGKRVPHEIRIASVTPQALAAMAEQPPESQPSTEPKPPALSAAPSAAIERAFFSGNPRPDAPGMLHLMKDTGDWGSARPSVLVMLAVPAHMTVIDLAQFRTGRPGQFMVLLQFTDQAAAADQFYSAKHGEPFSSLEPELTCCLALRGPRGDPVPRRPVPVRELVELPTCPVCLDRLDEPLKGILTILCNHSFHCAAWTSGTRPLAPCAATLPPRRAPTATAAPCVRRHRQSVDLPDLRLRLAAAATRPAGTRGHGERTAGLGLLRRQLRPPAGAEQGPTATTRAGRRRRTGTNKLDAVTLEYTYLLTSQLESQRLYYEEQLEQQAAKPARDSAAEVLSFSASTRYHHRRSRSGSSPGSARMAELEEARRERAALDKRLGQTNSRLQKLQKELDEERAASTRAMLANQQRDLQERLQAE